MSRRSLSRKLLAATARKAWKCITSNIHCKLHKLANSTLIKQASHRILSIVLLPFKRRRLLTRRSSSPDAWALRSYHHYSYNYKYQSSDLYQKNFAPIYIDELFDEPVLPTGPHKRACAIRGETSGSKGAKAEVDKEEEGERACDIDEKWNAVVAMSPQLRVDERAEEFISKFKEDMKLQRDMSDLEFREMLKRSA